MLTLCWHISRVCPPEKYNLCKKGWSAHSFIFMAAFSPGRVPGAAALGLEVPHEQEQTQIDLLAQHQDMQARSEM